MVSTAGTDDTSCAHDCGSHQRAFPCTLVGAESAPDITLTHGVGDSRHTAANPQETTHDPRNGVSGAASVSALSIVTIVDSGVSTRTVVSTPLTPTQTAATSLTVTTSGLAAEDAGMAVADRIRLLPCRAAVAAVASMFFGVVLMLCCVVLDSAVCVTTCACIGVCRLRVVNMCQLPGVFVSAGIVIMCIYILLPCLLCLS